MRRIFAKHLLSIEIKKRIYHTVRTASFTVVILRDLLRQFENTQQTCATQDGHTHWIDNLKLHQEYFKYRYDHHEEVKAVEQFREVIGPTRCSHFYEHFQREQGDEYIVRKVLIGSVWKRTKLCCENFNEIQISEKNVKTHCVIGSPV